MRTRFVIALLATSFTAEAAFAADWPITAPWLYHAGPFMPVQWTGLYFGVNAGYGWGQGSANTFFTGDFPGGTTTPNGVGRSELSRTRLHGSGNLSGAIAGGQIGFNWQAGMFIFGAEIDGQWSGQQGSFTVACTTSCAASENVRIKSLATARGRFGLAFDWMMPYVTAGAALVNASDDLIATAGGLTGSFQSFGASTLGWTAGAGVEVALWGNWSAKLEYLHIQVEDLISNTRIPNPLGIGDASEDAGYHNNIVRVGLNYRFGPRGGPGLLEQRIAAPAAYASAYDFLPSMAMFAETRREKRPQASPGVAVTAAQQLPPVASTVASEPRPGTTVSVTNELNFAKSAFKNFDETEDAEELPYSIKLPSLKQRQKGDDDSQRLKRIMTICSGC
jgi:opacity protein-like surface antigen